MKMRIVFHVVVGIFAVIGFLFTAVFVAMQFDLLNVRGTIAERNSFFTDAKMELENTGIFYSFSNPTNVSTSSSDDVAHEMVHEPCMDTALSSCVWSATPEWDVVKSGLIKDASIIKKVSEETGVPARLIVAVVVPEQLRFFTSNREVFKRWFEPMKILGTLTKFSLGVSGIKLETALEVEKNAQDSMSLFYPGENMYNLIAYASSTADRDKELFNRLTNEEDHYYSYMYTALFIKEIIEQWKRFGFDLEKNPGVVVTLFNIGFDKSVPHENPEIGGALVTVGGGDYSYGEIGLQFYASTELIDVFLP